MPLGTANRGKIYYNQQQEEDKETAIKLENYTQENNQEYQK